MEPLQEDAFFQPVLSVNTATLFELIRREIDKLEQESSLVVDGKRPRSLLDSPENNLSPQRQKRSLSPQPEDSEGTQVSSLTVRLEGTVIPNKIVKLLSTHSDLHHPQPLCRIDLAQTKSYAKGGLHALSVILKSSKRDDTVLFRLDPGFGKQFFGQASLLDSLAYLSVHDYHTIRLESYLSYYPPNIDSPEPIFRLHISISLLDSFFASGFSGPKQLFLDWLIPPPPLPPGPNREETTIDYFYSCLGRAPRTFRGLAIDESLEVEPPALAEVETEESKRKKLKGKGKAWEYSHDQPLREEKEKIVSSHGTEEDTLLKPVGLVPELMPFQSRSVRWLLAREGKRVAPPLAGETRKDQVKPTAGSSVLPLGEKPNGVTENSHQLPSTSHDHDQLEIEGVSNADSSSDGEEFGETPPIILNDLPPSQMLRLTRGPFWEQISLKHPDASIKEYWYNRLERSLKKADPALMKGDKMAGFGQGLLCEEMGCGKTVEIISLILLHRQPERNLLPTYMDETIDSEVQPCGATLVIAPAAIVSQWGTEFAKHAPSLRILRYDAIKTLPTKHTALYIATHYDVVLTTFDTLRKEVVFARKPFERNTRSAKESKHRYRRSLLVQLDFLRVCIDEAQMVGDSVSLASETASLIPRKFSFAVTGTPLKSRREDLQGLLKFLKIAPAGSSKPMFARLLDDPVLVARFCAQVAARTLKSQVEHELFIPKQSRMVVPIDFTAAESYYYDESYKNALDSIGLEVDGTPKGFDTNQGENIDWQPSKVDMNRWLVTLRQLCCHPQIGYRNKQVLGSVIKTVEDVLFTMRDLAVSTLQNEQRAYWAQRVKRAQLMMWDREDCEGIDHAVALFQGAVAELEPVVQEVAGAIRQIWKHRREDREKSGRATSVDPADVEGLGAALGLGFGEDTRLDGGLPISEKERQNLGRLSTLRTRLRELLFVQHSANFFMGSAYFNLGKFSELEAEAYATADVLRQTILQPWETAVENSAKRLRSQMDARDEESPLDIDDLEVPFNSAGHGIIAAEVFESIAETSDNLNTIAELIWQWREMLFRMLYTKVTISGDDATGDEYAERAELQEKLDVYLEAYGVLLSDWRALLNGNRSALANALDLEGISLEKKNVWDIVGRTRPANRKDRKRDIILHRIAPTLEKGDAPADILRYELLMERLEARGDIARVEAAEEVRVARELRRAAEEEAKKVAEAAEGKGKGKVGKKGAGSSRGRAKKGKRVVDSEEEDEDEDEEEHEEEGAGRVKEKRQEVEDEVNTDALPILQAIKKLKDALDIPHHKQEVVLLKLEYRRLKAFLPIREKVFDRLQAELSDITKSFNARCEYFAQLQQLSDEVADPDFTLRTWKGFSKEMRNRLEEERVLEASIKQKTSQRRYLENMVEEEISGEEERMCIICSDTYTQGVVTSCGHLYCQTCFDVWFKRSHGCATCKRILKPVDYGIVSYAQKKDKTGERLGSGTPSSEDIEMKEIGREKEKLTALNTIDYAMMDEIKRMESFDPLSSKSDLIVKHVKYIRSKDPEAKIVIFSAWTESLAILMAAFNRNGLQYVRLETGGKKDVIVQKFITDPSISTFFLHTRSQSAGLNLVVAKYVFLVEPLLIPGLELQAAGRIHRMGQTQETTVFQYYIKDTVDARVAELRARQQSSLFLKATQESIITRDSRMSGIGVANTAASAGKNLKGNSEEAIEDQDDITQLLLLPLHFLNLQQALLPPSLRSKAGKVKYMTNKEKGVAAAMLRASTSQVGLGVGWSGI